MQQSHGSSLDELRQASSYNASNSQKTMGGSGLSIGAANGVVSRRQESTLLIEAIDESGGDLAVFVEKLLPANKVKRVPELVSKLQEIGCDTVEDLKVRRIENQYQPLLYLANLSTPTKHGSPTSASKPSTKS